MGPAIGTWAVLYSFTALRGSHTRPRAEKALTLNSKHLQSSGSDRKAAPFCTGRLRCHGSTVLPSVHLLLKGLEKEPMAGRCPSCRPREGSTVQGAVVQPGLCSNPAQPQCSRQIILFSSPQFPHLENEANNSHLTFMLRNSMCKVTGIWKVLNRWEWR